MPAPKLRRNSRTFSLSLSNSATGSPAERMRSIASRFHAVGEWHPWVSQVQHEGPVRIPVDRDGNRQTERLLESSAEHHFYRYRMESTGLPVRDWHAELRVDDNRDGSSTVVWSAEFEPVADNVETTARIGNFMRAGLDHLAATHGNGSVPFF